MLDKNGNLNTVVVLIILYGIFLVCSQLAFKFAENMFFEHDTIDVRWWHGMMTRMMTMFFFMFSLPVLVRKD